MILHLNKFESPPAKGFFAKQVQWFWKKIFKSVNYVYYFPIISTKDRVYIETHLNPCT